MTSENFFSELDLLKAEIQSLRIQTLKQAELEARLVAEVEWHREQFILLKRALYGTKKERFESQEQGCLFNEAEVEALKPESDEGSESKVAVGGFTRARGKRKPLPDYLPREIIVIELPKEEQFSADGTALKVIGKEVSEKFVYEPASMKVIEYHRLRYGFGSGDPVKTAPPVPQIIPKGIITASVLADIVVKKYADGLPLYRQEEIWDRQGIEMSRTSMGRWVIQGAEACIPIWNVLEERLMASSYVSADETRTQVLKENERPAESKSWMWIRATPVEVRKIVLFDYDPSRSGEVASRLFAGFKGFLQVDGYSGYNPLEKQEGVIRIGCNMHGRRGFDEAKIASKSNKGLSETGLRYYQKLYDLEEKYKMEALTPDERKRRRDQEAFPIWEAMKAWAETHLPKVPIKSKTGIALNYFLNQYDLLRGYLQNGILEIDNGFAERAIRKFAIGRNNWLFSDSVAGANASALFYSFVVTAKVNGVEPYQALKKIFEQIPAAKTVDDYERLADLLMVPEPKKAQ